MQARELLASPTAALQGAVTASMRTQLARLAQLCSRAAAVPAGVARLCQAGSLPQLQVTRSRALAISPPVNINTSLQAAQIVRRTRSASGPQALTWARGAAAMPACAAAASSTLQGGWAVHWPLVSLAAAQPAAAAAPLIEHATLLGGGVPALEGVAARVPADRGAAAAPLLGLGRPRTWAKPYRPSAPCATSELRADSVQRKRKRAMNKHKHRKRRKLNRHRR